MKCHPCIKAEATHKCEHIWHILRCWQSVTLLLTHSYNATLQCDKIARFRKMCRKTAKIDGYKHDTKTDQKSKQMSVWLEIFAWTEKCRSYLFGWRDSV